MIAATSKALVVSSMSGRECVGEGRADESSELLAECTEIERLAYHDEV
jgi:hypothetical protein